KRGAGPVGPPCARLLSILRIEIRADAGAVAPIPDSARSSPMVGRVRRLLHLQPAWHRTASLVYRALHITAAPLLSPFVAGGVAPCGISVSLQPFDKKSLRENTAGWYRFCLVLEYR